MSQRWSYAFLAVLIGCGNTPVANTDFDASTPDTPAATDTASGSDVVDAGRADTGGGTDVVDAGTGTDVVDAGTGTDVVDAGAGTDVVDAGAGTDVVDAGAADVPRVSVGCAMPAGSFTLPGMNAPAMGTLRGMSMQPSTGCRSDAPGPEDVYTLNVTARTGVILSTEGMGTDFDTLVSIRRTCTDVATEVACDDDGVSSTSVSSAARAVLEPGTYSVLVEGFAGRTGNYVLNATTYTPADNAVCTAPAMLAPGAMLSGDLAGAGATRPTVCNRNSDSGVLYYSVTVPASSRVSVTVTTTGDGGTWTPSVRAVDSCTATTCVGTGTGASPVVLANGGNTPRTFTVLVSRSGWLNAGTFTIAASAPAAITEGTDCAAPRTLTPGTDLTAQDTSVGFAPSNACITSNNGNQLFYRLTVPAGQVARVSATSTGMTARSPVVRVLDACPATACSDYNVGTTTTDGVAFAANPDATPRTVIVSVSTTGGATINGTFTVRAALNALGPMGARCEAPVVLTPGTALAGVPTSAGFRPNRICSGTELGPQIFYQVTIPPRNRSRIQVTPAMGAMWTPRLRVLTDCNLTACLSSTAATTAGGAVETTLVNDTEMPRTVLFSVAATSATAMVGAYQVLATNSAVPGYNRTTVMGACDDLSTGATAIGPGSATPPDGGVAAWTDDSASAIAALPFGLSYFGDAVTHFSVTSNGFLQLWPSMMGTASTTPSNASLPSIGTPNGVVAPFWDDLAPINAMTTGVRSATLGTMPNRRFVVEWFGWDTFSSTMSNLRFQAKLFEGTNAIEFHYCAMNGMSPRVRGSEATVGIEDLSGSFASQASHNTADSVSVMTAQRFLPR